MALPPIVEHLLSRRRGTGGIVHQAVHQILVPVLPAQTQVVVYSMPTATDYMQIVYKGFMSPAVVANTVFTVAQYHGNQTMSAIVDQTLIGRELDSFLIVTQKQPAILTLRNRTNVAQAYFAFGEFLVVRTEGDYKEVVHELENVGNSLMEPLAIQANAMLTSINNHMGGRS